MCRYAGRILQNANRAQQAGLVEHVSWPVHVSRIMNFSAGSVVPNGKIGGRIIQGGRLRLTFSCRSFFEARALMTCR